jgi:hypothetical protein
MKSGFIFGILGSVLILAGVFLPLASVPVWGEINLFQLCEILTLELLVVAVLHLSFCVRQIWWGLYITKSMVVGAFVHGIYVNWDLITGNTSFLTKAATEILSPVTKFQYGIAVLMGGLIILMVAPIPPRPRKMKPAPLEQPQEHAVRESVLQK